MKFLSCFAILLFALPVFSQIAETAENTKSIAKGAQAPEGKLISADGTATTLADLTKAKPVALVFYRGDWCPLCMRHLKQFDKVAAELKTAGYQLIAVSPDKADKLARTQKKLGLSYPLYSDPDSMLAQAFGIAFKAKRSMVLPTPAVYAIDAEGTLVFAHADANYRKRLAPENLLASIKE